MDDNVEMHSGGISTHFFIMLFWCIQISHPKNRMLIGLLQFIFYKSFLFSYEIVIISIACMNYEWECFISPM